MNILNKSTVKIFAAAMIASSVLFTSCSKDDDDIILSKPLITNLEVGSGNSHIGTIGSDLHLEADVEAAGKISTIEVEIHKEGGSGWEFHKVYDEFAGQLNTTFHKHIDIPSSAEPGHYHLHFKVTDQQGQVTVKEEELELKAEGDININITELGHGTIGSSHTHAGSDMHVEGTITSVYPIATIQIEIHNETDPSAPEIEVTYTNYTGQTTANFHEHVDIPASQPAGDYHFHFTVTDNQGNSKTVEYELEIE